MENSEEKTRKGEVHNMGGGRKNYTSLLESFKLIESITGKLMKYVIKKARKGDHKVYISDLNKFKKHYSDWDIRIDLKQVFTDLYNSFINN